MRGGDWRRLGRRAAVAAGLTTLCCLGLGAAHAAAADLLPDLGMARLTDMTVERTAEGQRLLRYTAVITNTGAGPFELTGHRSSASEPEMSVEQRIYDDEGGSRVVPTDATMYFAGDGHHHWHVKDLETGELLRLRYGNQVAALAKHGFCFSDNVEFRLSLPGAPASPAYTDCGVESDLDVTVGLSVGWGDRYGYTTYFQYIDITGLPTGSYRLRATADKAHSFVESDSTNNTTWVDIKIKRGRRVKVIRYGPSSSTAAVPAFLGHATRWPSQASTSAALRSGGKTG